MGDLSAQSINGALILLSSYRFRAPLEMTCEAGAAGIGIGIGTGTGLSLEAVEKMKESME